MKAYVTFEDRFKVVCKKCGSEKVDISVDECKEKYNYQLSAYCNNCKTKFNYINT